MCPPSNSPHIPPVPNTGLLMELTVSVGCCCHLSIKFDEDHWGMLDAVRLEMAGESSPNTEGPSTCGADGYRHIRRTGSSGLEVFNFRFDTGFVSTGKVKGECGPLCVSMNRRWAGKEETELGPCEHVSHIMFNVHWGEDRSIQYVKGKRTGTGNGNRRGHRGAWMRGKKCLKHEQRGMGYNARVVDPSF